MVINVGMTYVDSGALRMSEPLDVCRLRVACGAPSIGPCSVRCGGREGSIARDASGMAPVLCALVESHFPSGGGAIRETPLPRANGACDRVRACVCVCE